MASVKNAAGNVLDTVVSVANTVTDTVSMVSKAAQAGNKWMDAMLASQTVAIAVDLEMFKSTYVQRKASQLAQERKTICLWADESPVNKQLYEDALVQLSAVVASIKSTLR